ncbi:hypothetical protein D9619_000187 [Psilocybe cf. subviscida]|uniref:NACHT domain-containing protein n=1 Tax=Psilocybe cf. subviscida TaxID=2480587 RepID=A0A8H5BGM0_9AGAR|nr:hypothetical protein D9619_000187 [Psilocybe cf. subviscida]
MFANARNVIITGNTSFNHYGNSYASGAAGDALDEGIKLLLQHVAKGAMHNSGERFDAPTCHPETRLAIQEDILGWADEWPSTELVTWMYGPAGAGKSAIAQTISQKLHQTGQLTASFFFSRASGSKGRGDETRLMATLAYQLSQSIPGTRPHISSTVRDNPIVFDLSLDSQVQALIIAPLTAVYDESAGPQGRRVIVVDGLDECRKEDNAQSRVVSALIMGLSNIPNRSHKLFITSRPEHNIATIFRGYKQELVRKMELNNKWNPDDDIRTFLIAGFADIRRTHPYFESHPTDKTWPSRPDMNALVARSSGQFIYASVVIKYIKSEDYYDPAARLEIILKLKNNEDRPYAELDALYEHIFSQIRGVEKVLTVLSLERMHSESKFNAPLSLILSDFIGARIEEVKFWLRPLISLLVWENDVIRYMHASLPDFLADQSRSSSFCIYSTSIATMIVRRGVDMLEDEDTLTRHHLIPILLRMPRYYTRKLLPNHKIHIHSMISDFNVVESVLSRMHAGLVAYETTRALASYIEWVLTESESGNPLECRQALVEPLSQIQTWLMQHLAYESFNGLDNIDQVDLWPFFIFPNVRVACCAEDLQRQVSDDIALALEICGPTTFSYQLARDEDVELSDQTVLLCCLMPYISQWLKRADLLGRYAITRERYAVALLRTSRYLLRLPKDQHAEVFNDGKPGNTKLSASMLLARKAFSTFMGLAPRTIELYFFVLFMYSVIVEYREVSSKEVLKRQQKTAGLVRRMATSAKHYLEMTRKNFPILYDPTTPEYFQAQANAEATWIKIKGDFYDPIISILVQPPPDPEQERKHWRATHVHRSKPDMEVQGNRLTTPDKENHHPTGLLQTLSANLRMPSTDIQTAVQELQRSRHSEITLAAFLYSSPLVEYLLVGQRRQRARSCTELAQLSRLRMPETPQPPAAMALGHGVDHSAMTDVGCVISSYAAMVLPEAPNPERTQLVKSC